MFLCQTSHCDPKRAPGQSDIGIFICPSIRDVMILMSNQSLLFHCPRWVLHVRICNGKSASDGRGENLPSRGQLQNLPGGGTSGSPLPANGMAPRAGNAMQDSDPCGPCGYSSLARRPPPVRRPQTAGVTGPPGRPPTTPKSDV